MKFHKLKMALMLIVILVASFAFGSYATASYIKKTVIEANK